MISKEVKTKINASNSFLGALVCMPRWCLSELLEDI